MYYAADPKRTAYLFQGWEETLIWSCLQGCMGRIYSDDPESPTSAVATIGDFCFFAGKPKEALVHDLSEHCRADFAIMVPQTKGWADVIERYYPHNARKVTRYATKKEPDCFDEDRLHGFVSGLSEEYTLEKIDRTLFAYCKQTDWCRDFVSQYDTYEVYQRYGLGVMIRKGEEPVAGASSYAGYRNGIEIEIDTKEEYRRKGLATVCGAKLILECRKKGWYPSWDAQNIWSLALAEKLGYHFSHEYDAYEIYNRQ